MSNYSLKAIIVSHITLKELVVFTIYCLIFRTQIAQSINKVLDINGTFPYLINRTDGTIIEPQDYMDFENLYAPNESYKQHQTAQGRNYHLLKAFDFANYYQSDYWHYSNEQDLMLSAHPVANEHRCSLHLEWLDHQLNSSEEVMFHRGEEHLNLMTLMDAFGRPEAGTYLGRGHWLGSYYECSRASINMQKFDLEKCREHGDVTKTDVCQFPGIDNSNVSSRFSNGQPTEGASPEGERLLKARYCLGKARDIDWPSQIEDNYVPRISYKIGLCLPESCETLSFSKHKALIERLMHFNMPAHVKSRIFLEDIYCLPDNRSPVRALSTSARIYLMLCASWMMLLISSTWLYTCYKRNQLNDIESMSREKNGQEENGGIRDGYQQIELRLSETGQLNDGFKLRDTTNLDNTIREYPMRLQRIDHSLPPPPSPVANGHPATKSAISNDNQLLVIKSVESAALTTPNLETHNNPLEVRTNNNEQYTDNKQFNSALHTTSYHQRVESSIFITKRLNDSSLLIRMLRALSIKTNMIEFLRPPLLLRDPDSNKKLRINLNPLDFIKCLCCVLVILGHIVFIYMQHLQNIIHTIELSYEIAPRILISFFNFVDTFFIISGMLTAYFIFKRFNKRTFANPLVWLSITLLRLARLSPVYILTFWFSKTLVVYMGEGPLWDYGTDKNSNKGLCINDHWWKSILYIGNLGTMQPLCILPAWSIIVESQYSILLPPILFIIFKYKRFGYLSLLMATIISTTNMSIQLANQKAVKTSDMAKVRLHVYPLISRFSADFYNAAWNRIGPVAIGIFGGHMLYLYDVGKIRQWPWFMVGKPFKIVLFMHVFIFMLPSIGLLTDPPESTKDTNVTIFIISNATIKPIWALINTVFLLRIITDLRGATFMGRLMSHNIWHCLGKLCFISYLVHYEIILMLLKSRKEGLPDPTWLNVIREFSLAFMISTIVAYFVYILFEAPINNLLMLFLAKPKYQQKPKKNREATKSDL